MIYLVSLEEVYAAWMRVQAYRKVFTATSGSDTGYNRISS